LTKADAKESQNQTPAPGSLCLLELGDFMLSKNTLFPNKKNWKQGITLF